MPQAICSRCGEGLPTGSSTAQCPHCLLAMAAVVATSSDHSTAAQYRMQQRRIGDYVLGRQIASGGMGVVYEAQQVSLSRRVALKFIRDSMIASPTMLRRFTIEAEAAARLHHPNIVRIHEIGEADGQPYFSMDLIEGDSLRTKIRKRALAVRKEGSQSSGRTAQVTIARLLAKTARAAHHAHQRGVLHRDLKPENILVDNHGEPHLTDFGLAKILRESAEPGSRADLTQPGEIAGTPSYMAPEQLASAPATVASDVYALGAILYELLTGRAPFVGDTPLEICRHVQEQTPLRPRNLNPVVDRDLDTICMKCLEKDPRYRYTSAEALANDLENWIEHKPINARPAGPVRKSIQWMRRNRIGTGLIAICVLGFVSSILILQVVKRQRDQNDEQRAALLRMVMDRMTEVWTSTNVSRVTIESGHLALLAGQSPAYDFTAPRLTFGISHVGDPRSFAQARASFLHALEKNLSQLLEERVFLDLVVFKPGIDDAELLLSGEVDLLFLNAITFCKARERNPRLLPVARERADNQAVIVASRRSGLRQLAEIRTHSFAFPPRDDALTVYAQALLLNNGIRRSHLGEVRYFEVGLDHSAEASPYTFGKISRREALSSIHRGEVAVGATTRKRYLLERHRGLIELATFTYPGNIFAAREGLNPRYAIAFRNALIRTHHKDSAKQVPLADSPDWEDPFGGAVETSQDFLRGLKHKLTTARQFDQAKAD